MKKDWMDVAFEVSLVISMLAVAFATLAFGILLLRGR